MLSSTIRSVRKPRSTVWRLRSVRAKSPAAKTRNRQMVICTAIKPRRSQVRPSPLLERGASFKAGSSSGRVASRAGARPNKIAVTTERPSVNAMTARFGRTTIVELAPESIAASVRSSTPASSNPQTPPNLPRRSLSPRNRPINPEPAPTLRGAAHAHEWLGHRHGNLEVVAALQLRAVETGLRDAHNLERLRVE